MAGICASAALAPLPCLAQPAADEAIYTGDVVVVAADPAVAGQPGTTSPSRIVAPRGAKMHVTEVRDGWIGGTIDIDGKAQKLWLRRRDVRLETLPAEAAGPLVLPDRPDDPAAVAALERRGVKLERNDKGNVHAVDATEARLADAELVQLRGLHQMISVDLSGCPVTDAGVRELARLRGLQALYLNETQVTNDGLAALRNLVHLEILALQKTRITGAGLKSLHAMSRLLVLNLGGCQITDDDLRHLQPLSLLEVLTLAGTKVTSAGIPHLKPNAKLRVLNLIGCAVDDQGLEPMKSLGNLRIVHIRGTQITPEGVEAMGEVYPLLAFFN